MLFFEGRCSPPLLSFIASSWFYSSQWGKLPWEQAQALNMGFTTRYCLFTEEGSRLPEQKLSSSARDCETNHHPSQQPERERVREEGEREMERENSMELEMGLNLNAASSTPLLPTPNLGGVQILLHVSYLAPMGQIKILPLWTALGPVKSRPLFCGFGLSLAEMEGERVKTLPGRDGGGNRDREREWFLCCVIKCLVLLFCYCQCWVCMCHWGVGKWPIFFFN